MPVILKIGYQEYLVKNEKAALAALTALCGAVRLQSRHIQRNKTYREYYWPSEREESEISIKTVTPDQLLARDPGANEPFDEPKRLPFRTV